MSQHDFSIANQTASIARADINNALQALASNNSGNSAPSTTYANMWWYENDTNLLKIRNESDNGWISVAYLDGSNWEILDNTQVVNTSGTQIGVLGDQATSTWETGTGTTESLVSPAKVAASATEVVADYALGVGQTWTDFSSSGRSANTSYRNTTGRPIQVAISGAIVGAEGRIQVSSNNSTWISVGNIGQSGAFRAGGAPIVPNLYYYRATNGFDEWAELR